MLTAHVHSGSFAWIDMLPGVVAYFIWPGYVRSFQVEGREACGQRTLAPVHLIQPERSQGGQLLRLQPAGSGRVAAAAVAGAPCCP